MSGEAPLRVSNPASGELLAEVRPAGEAEVETAVARARAGQPAWQGLGFDGRARLLRDLARRIRDDASLLCTLVAESGKPRFEAEGWERLYTLEVTRFFTSRPARRAMADELRRPHLFAHKRSRVVRHPRGVVAVIGPWNFPLLNNYADCVAPLAAGNAVVLKPSESTPLTSLRVAELAGEVGLPPGSFQVLAGGPETGAALVARADAVFFTGGVEAGRAVAAAAAARLIPAVLELGGKSAMIVCADADLERAAEAAVWSAFAHSGQVCIRTERVYVEAAAAERFEALVAAAARRLHPGSDLGFLTTDRQLEVAERQLADAVARGARVLSGGRRRPGPGRAFEPTVLAGCTEDMAVLREETFAPLLPIARVESAEEAVRRANASTRGLSGSVWSRDLGRARSLARTLETGSVCLNDVLVHYFCVESPLGGVKSSGLGHRHGVEALLAFTRTETIVEPAPLLGWLTPVVSRRIGFPYLERNLRRLEWLGRRLYRG